MFTVDITSEAPESFLSLAWETFFASRQRGISRAVNMPWLDDRHSYYVTLRDGRDMLGGLAVRSIKSELGYVAGLIGLVCIRPDQRGEGLSQIALTVAMSEAGRLGTDDLILWTGKPQVYEGLGFKLNDQSASGTVRGLPAPGNTPPPLRSAWPGSTDSRRGLPPFAVAGWRWTTPEASATVIEDSNSVILCEWQGQDAQVAELLAHVMPPEWRIYTLVGDTLPKELQTRGWKVDLTPSRNQMTKQLRQHDDMGDPYRLRLLDRI